MKLPHNLEAEESLLGSIVINPSCLEEIRITADDFYHPKHQTIFTTIQQMQIKMLPLDVITLSNELPEMTVDIARLFNKMHTAENANHYAGIILEKSKLRQILKTGRKIQALPQMEYESVNQLLDQAEKLVYELSATRTSSNIVKACDALREYTDMVDEANRKGTKITGIDTGYSKINYMTSGLNKQDLIILGARPSMGKTALALNILTNVSVKQKEPAVIFSLEMSRKKLVMRMIASLARIDLAKLKLLNLNKLESQVYTMAYEKIEKAPLFIDDTPAISTMEILSKSRKLKKQHGLGLVVVDYLGLMSSHKGVSRYESVSENTRMLKNIARELDCPVLCLSQLSRDVEKRDNKRPMLSDLRETGEVEQTADMVWFLYRDEYYKPNSTNTTAELIIAKQRDGATGTVDLHWDKQYTLFSTIVNEGGVNNARNSEQPQQRANREYQ